MVIRTISSQLFAKPPNAKPILVACFDCLSDHFPHWKNPYLVVDGNPTTDSPWLRITSKIFPEETIPDTSNSASPLVFFINPKVGK